MRSRMFFVIFLYFVLLTLAFGKTESPLEKAEALMIELKFYEAVFALEPLLMSNEKSEDQEKALWLANMLCERVADGERGAERKLGFRRGDNTLQWEKAKALNPLGAGFGYEPVTGSGYIYHYGFLKRLLEFYPDSNRRPVAEYYLIYEGHHTVTTSKMDLDETLKALHAYVEKYQESGLGEVYMAYLDIAQINHGLWAFWAHPDGAWGYMMEKTTGDPKKDKEITAAFKAKALKYYAKFIASGHRGSYPRQREEALKDYKKVKNNVESGYGFIVSD